MRGAPKVPDMIHKFWIEQSAAEHPTAADIAWMESAWGGHLPAEFKAFLLQYGHVSLEDAAGVPRWITYEKHGDGVTEVQEASVWSFPDRHAMQRMRAWMCEDVAGPLLPEGHIVIATGGGDTYFLMKLDDANSPVLVWEEVDVPWGDQYNKTLSVVGTSLEDFLGRLRVD